MEVCRKQRPHYKTDLHTNSWWEANDSWNCHTDPFKAASFLLICLIIWPDQVHVREISLIMKRRYKLGPPMCMFTRALSFQKKPEGHQWFTSRHFCSTGQRSNTKHNHCWVFLLHLQDTKARVLSTCLSTCLQTWHALKLVLPSKNKWELI